MLSLCLMLGDRMGVVGIGGGLKIQDGRGDFGGATRGGIGVLADEIECAVSRLSRRRLRI